MRQIASVGFSSSFEVRWDEDRRLVVRVGKPGDQGRARFQFIVNEAEARADRAKMLHMGFSDARSAARDQHDLVGEAG